jgi:UDP-N-acetylglucosamine transferase subunit ALG13
VIFVTVSTGHFDPLIAACAALSDRESFLGQIGSSTVEPPFPHYRTGEPEKIIEDMRKAELVISHAGTGMLSMLYRLKKPCVVIPKQIRYGESNDGQVELGRKWAELGMGILCLEVDQLEAAIARCRRATFTFPQFPLVGHALLAAMGLPIPQAGSASRASAVGNP